MADEQNGLHGVQISLHAISFCDVDQTERPPFKAQNKLPTEQQIGDAFVAVSLERVSSGCRSLLVLKFNTEFLL
jgi:hypothetical protein